MTDESSPNRAPDEPSHKVDPRLAEGDLVKVARANDLTEGEFLQGLLLEEGVPSVLRRAPGFDVPDVLAAGPRDVLVAASGVPTARDVLLQADVEPPVPGSSASDRPSRVLAGLLIAAALVAAVICVAADVI